VSRISVWLGPRKTNVKKALVASLEAPRVSRSRLAAALLATLALCEVGFSGGAKATELVPFFWVEPPTVQIEDRPKPLFAPYGYYGVQGGCSRQPVWQGRRWRSVTVCRR